MTDPKTVFDRPDDHWAFITAARDQDFEGQFFDRKAIPAGKPSKSQIQDLIAEITESVSAFANRNRQGGLIVVGVNSTGEVVGTKHFTEEQRNSIANIDPLLRNHAAQVRAHFCKRHDGQDATITLIFAPHVEHGICEPPVPDRKRGYGKTRRISKSTSPVANSS